MKIFAERLKELRIEKALSLKQLSKNVGIGIASLSRWENNISDIHGEQLVLLANYFNVSTDYLLGREDY